MINIINNKEYDINININKSYIHIKNYLNINNISENKIEISLKDKLLIINGSSLIIKCMDEYEIIISGIIKDLEFNE